VKESTGDAGFVPFRYQGQYEDAETGLYYNRFRYYDPKIGQYTQQDPIGLVGRNPTLYGYVNNTLTLVDVIGLATEEWMRDLLRELLGENLQYGGVYFFKTGADEWYIGMTNNLYRRLKEHFGTTKLAQEYIESIGVILAPDASRSEIFVLENKTLELFREGVDDVFDGVPTSNKINSPGRNICQ